MCLIGCQQQLNLNLIQRVLIWILKKHQFEDAILISCFFQFKQALRKRMTPIGTHREQVSMAATEICMGILGAMPKNETLKSYALRKRQR